ncbi:MAG: hypothetical protein U1E16_07590 [Hyphomicrobiales bacterium]
MGLVLNEMELRKGANVRRYACRLAEGVTLEASVFAPEAILDLTSPRTLSFLPMAYLLAAGRRESLDVNCQLSEAEWNTFLFGYVPLMTDFYDLPVITVRRSAIVKPFVPPKTVAPQSALLFSGGVDSFYSLLKLIEHRRAPGYLVSINAGAYSDRQEWMAAFDNLDGIASKFGLPVIYMDTNFHHLFPKPNLASHSLRNLSAATLLAGLVSTLFYSTSETLRDINYAESKDTGVMSLMEPLLLNALQRQDISTVMFGNDVSRVSKTEQISSNAIVQSHLDVCTNSDYQVNRGKGPLNCGQCRKCIRTMFTLEAFGALDRFASCFQIDNFRQNRAAHMERLKQSHLLLDRDAVDLWLEREAAGS